MFERCEDVGISSCFPPSGKVLFLLNNDRPFRFFRLEVILGAAVVAPENKSRSRELCAALHVFEMIRLNHTQGEKGKEKNWFLFFFSSFSLKMLLTL